MSPRFQKWKELASDYAAVPGREKWGEYTLFIYSHEADLIREVEALEAELNALRNK